MLALVPDGPAAVAGLRHDDVVVAADGAPLPRAPDSAANSFAPAERIISALEDAFSDGRALLEIRRGGHVLPIEVSAALGCASRFQVAPSTRLNALADGRYVQLTSALVAAVPDEAELAGLIAHEMAHNILSHRARLNAAGIDRGLLQHFGRNARLTRDTEREADRFAVYLLVRAGYDPAALIRVWRRVAPREGAMFGGTHPSWSERIAIVRAEIAEVERLRAEGQEIRPAWTPAVLD
ncbi:MAG: M48 family metalloprotease [Allosphingosinicella sp.]|uniref:M48 family metallopeptidase n=1 Tax=Allosphingosinicella sp. TaxID=2823234 RepID=UPI00392CD6C1